MKAIILSAGQGRRLLPLTAISPKCLLNIGGRTVLEWQVRTLASAGIDDIVVVTGYGGDKVEKLVNRRLAHFGARTLYNPDYATADNLVSCWTARHEMNSDFLLLNGDTLFEPGVMDTLLSSQRLPITVTVSSKQKYDSDDMKVTIKMDRLIRIGKELPSDRVSAESIGLIYFRDQGPEIFCSALKRALENTDSRKKWYLSVIDKIAADQPVMTCSVTGLKWCEIDYPRDLKMAESLISAIYPRSHEFRNRNIFMEDGLMQLKVQAG